MDLHGKVLASLHEAEVKAWESLARYKFLMFGYHAAQWVILSRALGNPFPNPWRRLVESARLVVDKKKKAREDAEVTHELDRPADNDLDG